MATKTKKSASAAKTTRSKASGTAKSAKMSTAKKSSVTPKSAPKKSSAKSTKASANRSTTRTIKTPASKRTDNKKFPGYPKYGKENDIISKSKRIDENLDDEVLTEVKNNEKPKRSKIDQGQVKGETENVIREANDETTDLDGTKPNAKNKYDVDEEDLEALGPKDLSMDGGDDEQLKHRNRPVDFSGEDLDIPGSELDDDQEGVGSEDEENNSYSLGGDDKNNLEEGQEHEGSL